MSKEDKDSLDDEQLVEALEKAYRAAAAEHHEAAPEGKTGTLEVTIHSATGLPVETSFGGARRDRPDPYVVVDVIDANDQEFSATNRSARQSNESNPTFNFSSTVENVSGNAECFIKLWDYDRTSGDDLLGMVTVVAQPGESMPPRELEVHLDARFLGRDERSTCTVSYRYVEEGADAPTTENTRARAAADRDSGVVIRKEIREMSEAEQERYAAAVLQMAKTPASVEASGDHAYLRTGAPHTEFYRLGSYHGYPTDYCTHQTENFPGWHRAYLREYERALQAADRALGGDGAIALPYWDWLRPEINGQCVPDVIEKHFKEPPEEVVAELRRDVDAGRRQAQRFFESRGGDTRLYTQSAQHLSMSRQLSQVIGRRNLDGQVDECLNVGLHKHHAAKNRRTRSLENPHDGIHIGMRFPMASLGWAAFHPIFYLHHCNVDRIYSAYLATSHGLNSQHEFRTGNRALYRARLKPFNLEGSSRPFRPANTFDTRAIGYDYDALPKESGHMRELPTLAVFEDLKPLKFAYRSYEVHVAVTKAGDPAPDCDRTFDAWTGLAGYAGSADIFGGKGAKCSNCQSRPPYPVSVEIGQALRAVGATADDCALHTLILDADDGAVVEAVDGLPLPVVRGPFLLEGVTVEPGAEGAAVKRVQAYLAKFGYLKKHDDGPDGKYGDETKAAILAYQKSQGLAEDGVVGPKTLERMRYAARHDLPPEKIAALERKRNAAETAGRRRGWGGDGGRPCRSFCDAPCAGFTRPARECAGCGARDTRCAGGTCACHPLAAGYHDEL